MEARHHDACFFDAERGVVGMERNNHGLDVGTQPTWVGF